MRRSCLLLKLSRGLILSALAASLSACATAPVISAEEASPAKEPAQVLTADRQAPQPVAARRESPEYPSPHLAYKLQLPEKVTVWDKKIIYATEVWSGDILVVQPVTVTKTGSLTIAAGTTVYFDVPDKYYGKETPWLSVRGRLLIRGTGQMPVRLTSVFVRHHGNQDIVNAVSAKELAVDNAVFERGGWGLHIHDTPATVRSTTFKDNYGGARFKGEGISFTANRFEGNRIGVRLLNSTGANFTGNLFAGNLTGIFFRQGIKTPTIKRNNFDNYEYDLKLGENQTTNIDAPNNWWANATRADLEDYIYDGKDSEGVGTVYTAPLSGKPFPPEQP